MYTILPHCHDLAIGHAQVNFQRWKTFREHVYSNLVLLLNEHSNWIWSIEYVLIHSVVTEERSSSSDVPYNHAGRTLMLRSTMISFFSYRCSTNNGWQIYTAHNDIISCVLGLQFHSSLLTGVVSGGHSWSNSLVVIPRSSPSEGESIIAKHHDYCSILMFRCWYYLACSYPLIPEYPSCAKYPRRLLDFPVRPLY